MKYTFGIGAVVIAVLSGPLFAGGEGGARQAPQDSRLGPPRTLNSYFPFEPPATRAAWEKRRQQIRDNVLVANGLWPQPEKTPLNPVIHGKIERDGYTIEKVFFASYPGHYVCGNLYRPTGKAGKLPAILSPHGHWGPKMEGRFYDAGEKAAQQQIDQGAEKTMAGARYPLQARCAQLARMGCVVFHYDMVGYADSKQVPHRAGFLDAEAELRLQSFMGLQTWNTVRALDFLLSLPDVDPARVGVTGASGGGTQTFILGAIDDRPAAAFPAVMVSTGMQGGCICENCSYLRQDTGNVELAGLFAPRPLGMTGADDWTIEIETKGLPQLQALYKLYGAEDRVEGKTFKQFKHNYNQVSREVMYKLFNRHLKLGQPEPVVERPFVPVPPKELSVFDAEHPLPKDAVNAEGLRRYLTDASDRQLAALQPKDEKGLGEFRRVVGTALRVMVNDELPSPRQVDSTQNSASPADPYTLRYYVSRAGKRERVAVTSVAPQGANGTVVVWVHPEGGASLWKGRELVPAAQALHKAKATILAVDVFRTGPTAGARPSPVDPRFAGYTFGYNRPLLAERVHDILTAVAHARGQKGTKQVHLLGFEQAGPWVLLARGLCGDAVARTAADMHLFRFEKVRDAGDEMMLPGALKYGGLPALAALAAPGELLLHNHQGTGAGQWLPAAYKAAGHADRLQRHAQKQTAEQVVAWLLR
jgi:dienelactone hydrolase